MQTVSAAAPSAPAPRRAPVADAAAEPTLSSPSSSSSFPMLFPVTFLHDLPTLRGPGVAVRAPPGTAFRVGGAVLTHTLNYSASGRVVLGLTADPWAAAQQQQDDSEDVDEASAAAAARARTHSSATPVVDGASVAGRSPLGTPPALDGVGTPGAGSLVSSAPLTPSKRGDSSADPTAPQSAAAALRLGLLGRAGLSAEAASADATLPHFTAGGGEVRELEKALARERDAFIARVTTAYPLLHVVPPDALKEQRYAAAVPAGEPAAVSAARARSPTSAASSSALGMWGERRGATDSPGSPSSATLVVQLGDSVETTGKLRALAWGGCRPLVLRAATWRLLMDYAPPSLARQRAELGRKRAQYLANTQHYLPNGALENYIVHCGGGDSGRRPAGGQDGSSVAAPKPIGRLAAYSAISLGAGGGGTPRAPSMAAAAPDGLAHLAPHERLILSQIALDLPRHLTALFHCDRTVASLARCLFLWAQRHPAVGYVQGMDDIVAVFYRVFLTDALRQRQRERCADAAAVPGAGKAGRRTLADALGIPCHLSEQQVELWTRERLDAALDDLPAAYLQQAEADTYACAGRVLSALQDNFIHGQPGIVRGGERLEAILRLEDPALLRYFEECGVGLRAMCFQWLHCMLVRELPLPLCLRLWDTYLSVGSDGIARFHDYVCAALVLSLRKLATTRAPMDIAMQALRNPFSYLFPQGRVAPAAASTEDGGGADPDFAAEGTEQLSVAIVEEKDAAWMSMLIADAYRLSKQFPL